MAEAGDLFDIMSSFSLFFHFVCVCFLRQVCLTKKRRDEDCCGGRTRIIDIYRYLIPIIDDGLVVD